MELSFTTIGEVLIAVVSGVIDSDAAGRLLDELVEGARGGRKLIVDLSGVKMVTSAGVRGLVVAAKLSAAAGGGVRLCGARADVESLLRSLGYSYFLKFDRTVEASISALRAGTVRPESLEVYCARSISMRAPSAPRTAAPYRAARKLSA